MKNIAFVLIALGIIMMIYTGFNFVTEKKVIDLGPIQVNQKENHPVQWSPIVGGFLLVGGGLILVANKKKN